MTKDQRVRLVAEAMAYIQEEPGKFPGWEIDPKVDQVLFDCTAEAYPNIKITPALANFRMHWIGKTNGQPVKPHVWRRRWQNWLKGGAEWDPLITGKARDDRGQRSEVNGQQARRSLPAATCQPPARPQGQMTPAGEIARGELDKMKRIIGGG